MKRKEKLLSSLPTASHNEEGEGNQEKGKTIERHRRERYTRQ
jgi:hypothetical protein